MQKDGTQFKHWMVRLEKIDLTSSSWWAPRHNETEATSNVINNIRCKEIACASCIVPSKMIYEQGWCCLNKSCEKFFQFLDQSIKADALTYNSTFLNERTKWKGGAPLPKLVPSFPKIKKNEYGSEVEFKGGIACPNCLVPIRRIHWNGWICEQGCGFSLPLAPRDVPMALVHEETEKSMGTQARYFQVDARIVQVTHVVPGYKVTTFYMPNIPTELDQAGIIGSVTVFQPTSLALERQGGLNDLFGEFQKETREGNLKLQRRPARCRGELINLSNLCRTNILL